MIFPNKIVIHKNEPHFTFSHEDEWEDRKDSDYKHCSYCGSISPEDFYLILKDTDYPIELADQKYGYPHKFYIEIPKLPGMVKFYTRHIADLKDKETVNTLLDLITQKTKIRFVSHLEDKELIL